MRYLITFLRVQMWRTFFELHSNVGTESGNEGNAGKASHILVRRRFRKDDTLAYEKRGERKHRLGGFGPAAAQS